VTALQPKIFTAAQFVGYLKTEAKFMKNGDVQFTIQVPFEFKDLALPLTDAFGLPLSIDIQLWEPYARDIAENGL